jgi:hypothetical protein
MMMLGYQGIRSRGNSVALRTERVNRLTGCDCPRAGHVNMKPRLLEPSFHCGGICPETGDATGNGAYLYFHAFAYCEHIDNETMT